MLKMRRFRSSYACIKYHLGLCSPFIHFVVSNDSVKGQWRPWSDCADAQADLGLRCPHIPEDITIYSLPLIQERQLSVSGERMCTILIRGQSLPSKVWLGKLTELDITPFGLTGLNTNKQKTIYTLHVRSFQQYRKWKLPRDLIGIRFFLSTPW